MVLIKHLYGNPNNYKKISGQVPIFFFRDYHCKKHLTEAVGLSGIIQTHYYNLFFFKLRDSFLNLFIFFSLIFLNLQLYSQCPSGTAPTGKNLVVNGNFSAGNTGFSSAYGYCNSSNCLYPESLYAIGTNANFYHSAFSGHDHTTGNGNFMVVNGAGTPNSSVWCQTISVSPNSIYIFSTWVCSVHPTSPAKLQFSINGVLLGPVFTAPSTTNTWTNFSATWNSGSNSSINICIVNQNTTAGGNDFGLDDIFFQKCCTPISASAGNNVSICFGQSSTTLTANGSGDLPPYTYLWNNVNPSQSIIVGNGIYTVAVSNTAGCAPAYATVTVTSYSVAISANAGPDKTVCKQNPVTTLNGSVIGASGGIWSGGAGTFSPNNTTLSGLSYSPTPAELTAGFVNLTLTTTGNGSCTPGSDVVRINYVGFSGLVSFTQTPISCFGANNGSATVNIAGGTPNYTYSWNTVPAQYSATAINLAPGSYAVIVTNGIGCTSSNSTSIIQPSPLALASSITNELCSGGSNGSVSINASGGTVPYTYLWQPGNSTTPSINSEPAGVYSVTVTDANGCQKISSFTISQPSAITVALSPTPVTCFNGSDGKIISTVSGGNSPYTYNWSSGATSPDATGLQAGMITLAVTDNSVCPASNSVNITQPPALTANILSSNETCNSMNDGKATATVSGGNPGYTYLWSNGGTTSQISNLTSQQYTLTATDLKGCTATAFATITEPATLTINFISNRNVSCFGGNDGMVTASPLGGTVNYTYLWAPGGSTAAARTNLSACSYTVTVTDSKGCVSTNSIAITQPLAPLSVALSSLPVACYGGSNGSVSSSSADGTGPYSYNWMPGSMTAQNILNLSAATYTLTTTDALGCIAVNSIAVTQPGPILLTTSSVNSDCGLPNGQTSVAVSGGIFPYTYLWSPSGGTNATASGLTTGAYNVIVSDFNGCTSSQFGNVNENSAPVASIFSVTNVSCNGGSDGAAKVATTGGTYPFTYSWLPNGGIDSIATGLTAGSYTVTVTDVFGCKSLATTSPDITQPPPILINVLKTNVSCFGGNDGTGSAIASGGTFGYTYQWLPIGTFGSSISNLSANNYTVQVTDTNGCLQTLPVIISEPSQLNLVISSTSNVNCFGGNDGTAAITGGGGTPFYTYNWLPSGGNDSIGTGLLAGNYKVIITDFKGCKDSSSVTITQPVQALSVTSTVSPTSCFGGSNGTVSISAIGGTPSYSYQWTPAVSTNDTASGLIPGNYTLLVTDSKNCQVNLSFGITEPSAINGALVSVNPSCGLSNGSISPQISGGTPPYNYLWSYGAATTSAINGLGTGLYNLQVTDALNCSLSLSANLSIIPAPSISVASINNVSCYGRNDGSATISVTQGTSPYSINWYPSGGNNLTTSLLSMGTYKVFVTDAIGCQTADSVIIAEPAPIDVTISSMHNVLCNGGNTGSISVAATGGTGPLYTYLWSPSGSNISTANNLTIGTYTVNVTDQNNCVKAISASITQPTVLFSSFDSITNAACFNGFGSASLIASGGVLPYAYSWSAPAVGQTGSTANNLVAGNYTVTVTDSNGCVSSNNLIIKEPLQVITSTGANDTLCLGQSGSVSANAIGGAGNYYYAWQPSGSITSGTLPVSPTSDITYTVVAFDQIGCAGIPATVTAFVYNLTAANVQPVSVSPICPGQNSNVYAETTGPTGPLTYQWSPNLGTGAGSYLVTPTQPITYIVTVSTICGLSVTDSVDILFNPQPILSMTSGANSLCVPGSVPFFDNSITGNPNDPITSWDWNFGDGTISSQQNPVHSYTSPGTYMVTLMVSTAGGCTTNNSTASFTVTAYPVPTAAFSVNSTNLNLPFDELILNNQSIGANSYNWSFGDAGTSTLFNPHYLYTSVGVFQVQLIAMSQFGCLDTAFAEITTDADVIFPNVFTPNSDGPSGGTYDINNLNNDIFFPYTSGVIEFKLEIFDRWGEEIFESLNIKQGWDGYYRGALCQQDVYVWKAYLKLNNGKKINKSGDVTLLRH